MNKDKALKIDLENLIDRFNEGWHEGIEIDASDIMLLSNIREALEQPAQEPVYFVQHPNGYGWIDVDKNEYNQEKYDEDKWKLYTHPYQWQGLTDDEILQMKDDWGIDIDHWNDFARAIEQALREKNTS
jgi:hypothetical protein